jgi:hypothetical protein
VYGNGVHLYMIIRSVRHRGLLLLIEDNDSRELRNDLVRRLRNILAVLIAAADMGGVIGRPAGAFTSSRATVPVPGAFRLAAIGG